MYSSTLPILKLEIFVFFLLSYRSFIYSRYQFLIRYMIFKHFLSFHRLPLHTVDYFLCCSEVLEFDIVKLLYFFFVAYGFGVIAKKMPNQVSKNISLVFSFTIFIVMGLIFRSIFHFEFFF